MASVPITIDESSPPIENLAVKIDPYNTTEDLEAQFLKEWGFSLRDTYKLTLRFYKGKHWCFLPLTPIFDYQQLLIYLGSQYRFVHRVPRSKVRIQRTAVI